MSVEERAYMGEFPIAEEAGVELRAEFISKTYMHLAGAILAFVGLEVLLFQLPNVGDIALSMFSGWNWLIVLGAFMLVSYVAEKWARSSVSPARQYLGLGLFVAAESVIFLPLLYIARHHAGPDVIPTAATMTLLTFGGLTAIVFITRKNFSFLGPVLCLVGWVALGLILCGLIFGFTLGTVFPVAMIGLAAGYILYHTSAVLHDYRVGQHVSAALALFSSVALLFWYILIFLMNRE